MAWAFERMTINGFFLTVWCGNSWAIWRPGAAVLWPWFLSIVLLAWKTVGNTTSISIAVLNIMRAKGPMRLLNAWHCAFAWRGQCRWAASRSVNTLPLCKSMGFISREINGVIDHFVTVVQQSSLAVGPMLGNADQGSFWVKLITFSFGVRCEPRK